MVSKKEVAEVIEVNNQELADSKVSKRVASKTASTTKAKSSTVTKSAKATSTAKTSKSETKSKTSATKTTKKATTKNLVVSGVKASTGLTKTEKGITLLNAQERYALMEQLQAQNPNPKSELIYNNPFELICAVVLSAQATDISVNKATPALFKAAPDAHSMALLGQDGIAPFIKSIGLWRNKAKNLAALALELDQKYNGNVPGTFEELIKLPGVGSKTAKVVLNVAFGQPHIAVDTHIFRVCNRTGMCLGKTPQEVEKKLPALIDERFLKDAHHYILLHGRYNCTAQRFTSHCQNCVIAKYCKHNYNLS